MENMAINMRVITWVIALCATVSADPILWGTTNGGVSDEGQLVRYDLDAGTVTVVGSSGYPQWSDVARQPGSGQLYGVGGIYLGPTFSLFRIDSTTGVASPSLGSLNRSLVSDIEFGPDGTLYGNFWNWNAWGGMLITIDPTDASVTTAPNAFGSGLVNGAIGVDPNTNQLWGAESSSSAAPSIFTVDPVTGLASNIVRLGLNGVATSFGFSSLVVLEDGTMLGNRARASNLLYRINPYADPVSGLAEVELIPLTYDPAIVGKISGLTLAAPVPEPGTWTLFGLAAVGAWFLRRRR